MSLRVTVTAISKACRNAQTHAPLPHGAWTLRSWTFLLGLPLQCAVKSLSSLVRQANASSQGVFQMRTLLMLVVSTAIAFVVVTETYKGLDAITAHSVSLSDLMRG